MPRDQRQPQINYQFPTDRSDEAIIQRLNHYSAKQVAQLISRVLAVNFVQHGTPAYQALSRPPPRPASLNTPPTPLLHLRPIYESYFEYLGIVVIRQFEFHTESQLQAHPIPSSPPQAAVSGAPSSRLQQHILSGPALQRFVPYHSQRGLVLEPLAGHFIPSSDQRTRPANDRIETPQGTASRLGPAAMEERTPLDLVFYWSLPVAEGCRSSGHLLREEQRCQDIECACKLGCGQRICPIGGRLTPDTCNLKSKHGVYECSSMDSIGILVRYMKYD